MEAASQDVVTEYYDSYKDVQQDIWDHERKNTRSKIWWVALLLLASDIMGLWMANAFSAGTFGAVLIVPVLFGALGFWAAINPYPAIIVTIVLFVLLIAVTILAAGASSLLSGLLLKGVIVFLLLSGLNSAKEAAAAHRNLKAA